jgi:gamma-glutamyltranspeptidase / glutathione hydrolase
MTLQEAVEAPRVWTNGGDLEVEEAFPTEVRSRLTALGHVVKVVPRVAGGMNGVFRDPATGLLHGAACWRADGTPIGMSGGWTTKLASGEVPMATVP